jgi:hypothetical protein
VVLGAAACSAKKYHMLGYCIADTPALLAAVLSAQVFNTLSHIQHIAAAAAPKSLLCLMQIPVHHYMNVLVQHAVKNYEHYHCAIGAVGAVPPGQHSFCFAW